MNTLSAREYTMLASAQLWRNWLEKRLSNQGDLDSSLTGEVGRVYYTGMNLLLGSIFVPQYAIVVGLLYKRHVLYNLELFL
jgi:hypothetical protein